MQKQLWTLLTIALIFGQQQACAQSDSYYSSRSNPYKKTAGFGFSNPYHSKVNYPTFGTPTSLGGGFYNVPSGNANLPMWQAPSGYLYPWAPRPQSFRYAYPMPILVVPQSTQAAAPAVPPLSVVIKDLEKYVEKNQTSNKLTQQNIAGIKKKIDDIKTKEHSLRTAGGGMINPSDEAQMRRELSHIGSGLAMLIQQ